MNSVDPRPRRANLFIVGAPKCGTTAWVEYLGTHPDIFFSPKKERCFFALDLPNFRLTRSEEDYAELFADAGTARIVGEASAMYLFSEAAAREIGKYNSDSKILIFLRDQEEFLPSLHNQFLWEFAEEIEDFETVWKLSGRRPPETVPATCLEPRTLDYAAMGRFRQQVDRYLDVFPAAQIKVVNFRDWVADPRATYLEILDFLGLEDDGRDEFEPVNQGMTYRSRAVARAIVYPPKFIQNAARLVRRLTGWDGSIVSRAAWRLVSLLSADGYRKAITPALRDEIRRYYADDNAVLERTIGHASSVPKAANRPVRLSGDKLARSVGR